MPEVVDIGITNDITDSIAVDSHDQPHIALYDTIGGWSHIYHTTKIAGVWSLREQVDNADGLDWTSFASIAIDKIDNLYFVYSGWPLIPPGLPINVMYRAKVSGVWQSQVNITTDPVNQQLDPCFCWATWPLIGGVRTNVLQGTQYLSWKSFNVAIMFGSYLLIFPLRSRSYALSRREL